MRKFVAAASLLTGVALLASNTAWGGTSLGPAENYNPQINPADFTITLTNPYFSLPVGKKLVYEQETEEGKMRLEILIPGWTYAIMGVETLAYWNRVYIDDVLLEDTRDYLAQNKQTGDVWYFGEHVDNYEDGKLADHDGTWFAGKGTAKPGTWMIANPKVGDEFVHEFKGGKEYNVTRIVGINESITVPTGTYADCAKTFASAVPDGSTANYYFCKDIADIALEIDLKGPETAADSRIELVEVDKNGARGIDLPSAYAKEGIVAAKSGSAPAGSLENATLVGVLSVSDSDIQLIGKVESGGAPMKKVQVIDPNGRVVMDTVFADGNDVGQADIQFDTPEPSLEDMKRAYPEGKYEFHVVTVDNNFLGGTFNLSYDFATAPNFIYPSKGAANVPLENLVIKWKPLPDALKILFQIEDETAKVALKVDLPANATEFAVPNGWLRPDTEYVADIKVIGANGNQIVRDIKFVTANGL